MRDFKKLPTFPGGDKAVLIETAEAAGLSVNQLVVRCVHEHLPVVQSELSAKSGRVTNVDPLPDKVLERLYRERDDDPEGIDALMAAQPIYKPE